MRQLTVIELLTQATSRLPGPRPARWLDAELLLSHLLAGPRERLHREPERAVAPLVAQHFRALITKRAAGLPLAYLLGSQFFAGREFRVSPGVLIPRPETELLVERASALIPLSAKWLIADIGTGSGCVAITLAHLRPHSQVFATDKSLAALRIARQNAQRQGVAKRCRFLRGDLLSPLSGQGLDLIVANLPYLTPREIQNEPSISREPKMALAGGPDGLIIFRRFLRQYARRNQQPPLLLEIDPRRKPALTRLIQALLPKTNARWFRDLAGRVRVLYLKPKP